MQLEVRFVAQSWEHIEECFYGWYDACPYLLRLNRFYCMCKLRGEGYMRDRNVVQNKVKSESAACEILPHEPRNLQ